MSTATATATGVKDADTGERSVPAVATPATPEQPRSGALQPLSAAGLGSLVSSQSVIPVLIVVAAFIAISVAAILWATGPTYQVLYSNISEADGGAIIAELDRRGVPYEFGPGGQTILVPSEFVHPLRLQLAEQGLPKGGKVGFELLDSQAFGVSQFAQQVNFQRGLEGELGRSMESLGPVASARVHLAMAKPSVFVQQRLPAKASVILNMHTGRTLSDSQVNAIVHLISSSVPELTADNVSVVDQRGELLSQSENTISGLNSSQLKYAREVEASLQERVSTLLSPILGEDNYRVQVNADIDFSTVEETSEAYSPNQGTDLAAIRSSQLRANFSGDEAAARGIPGALSNTAPNWAPSPIDATDAEAQNPDGNAQANLQRDQVFNYELDRNIRHIRHQMGALQRLSVAVVVNHRPGVDEEGNPLLEAVPAEELDEITRLVQQAVGFSVQRGDEVEVINSPFKPIVIEEPEPLLWWKDPLIIDIGTTSLRYALAGILVLLGYRVIVRPLMRKHLGITFISKDEARMALPGGGSGYLDSDQGAVLGGDEGEGGAKAIPFARVDKSASYSEQLEELKKISKDDPRMIAMIVRNWVKQDG